MSPTRQPLVLPLSSPRAARVDVFKALASPVFEQRAWISLEREEDIPRGVIDLRPMREAEGV